MNELPEGARRLLALARTADEPSDAARERVRHGVLLAVGATSVAAAGAAVSHASASATTVAKLGIASSASKAALICATIATVGGAAWVMHSVPAPAVRAPAHAPAALHVRAQEAPSAPALQPQAPAAPEAATEAPAAAAFEARTPEAVPAEPRVRAAVASARRPAVPERPASAQSLHDEMTLLSEASAAVDRGDLAQARMLLTSHRTRFAAGQLRQERRGLEVLTRCMANEAGARVVARAYLRSAPDAVLSARIASACKLEPTP